MNFRVYSKFIFLLGFLLCALLWKAQSVSAASLLISWDPPTTNSDGSPLTDFGNPLYKVYYGTSSGTYTSSVLVQGSNTTTLNDLTGNTLYYVSATAINSLGNESARATEVFGVTPEEAATPQPTAIPTTPPASRPKTACLDFDGDGLSDGTLYSANKKGLSFISTLSSTSKTSTIQFGSQSEQVVPGDYLGTGKTQLATVGGKSGNLIWKIRDSDGASTTIPFSSPIDQVISGCDFDGDAKVDVAGFDSSRKLLNFRSSSTEQVISVTLSLSSKAQIIKLYCADISGDGADDIIVYSAQKAGKSLSKTGNPSTITAYQIDGTQIYKKDTTGSDISELFAIKPASGGLPIIGSMIKGSLANSLNVLFYPNPFNSKPSMLPPYKIKDLVQVTFGRYTQSKAKAKTSPFTGGLYLTKDKRAYMIDFAHKSKGPANMSVPPGSKVNLLRCINVVKLKK